MSLLYGRCTGGDWRSAKVRIADGRKRQLMSMRLGRDPFCEVEVRQLGFVGIPIQAPLLRGFSKYMNRNGVAKLFYDFVGTQTRLILSREVREFLAWAQIPTADLVLRSRKLYTVHWEHQMKPRVSLTS